MSLKNLMPLIISALLSLGGSLLINFFIPNLYSAFWFVSLLFHGLISFLILLLLCRKSDDQRDYTFKLMFASMGRLLLCMIALLIYKVSDKEHFTPFALHFVVHYILFTAFEIKFLLKFIKEQKN